MRRKSFESIEETSRDEDGSMVCYSSSFKFLDADLDSVVSIGCNCHPILMSKYCLIHSNDLCMPALPPTRAETDALLKKLGCTGHSFRRTLALVIRIKAHEMEVPAEEIQMRTNAHFKWARKSSQLKGYTPDWQTLAKFQLPVLNGVTKLLVDESVAELRLKYSNELKRFRRMSLNLWGDMD